MILVDSNVPMYMVGEPHPNKQAALRLLDWKGMLFVLCYAAAFFGCSLLLWRASLKAYSSASS